MNTSGFIEKLIRIREHFGLFDDTAVVAVGDGRLELHEVDALIACLHMVQTDVGKSIYNLQQARIILASREGKTTTMDNCNGPVAP